jgi:hypothetical protein
MQDGTLWRDSGGKEFGCDYYAKGTRCLQYGSKFPNKEGVDAATACCVCGGGAALGGSLWGQPKADEGDNILSEPWGGVDFRHKKHIKGGSVLYWKVDTDNKEVTQSL